MKKSSIIRLATIVGIAATAILVGPTAGMAIGATSTQTRGVDTVTITADAPTAATRKDPQGGHLSIANLLRAATQANVIPAETPMTGEDDMTVDECRAQSSAFTGEGFGKSRFVSCQAHNVTATHSLCSQAGCSLIGFATFEMTDITHGNNGSRTADTVQVLDNWHLDGDIADTTITTQLDCMPNVGSGPCVVADGIGGPYSQTIGQWAAEGVATRDFDYAQPDSAGFGPDVVSFADLNWDITLSSDDALPVQASGPPTEFRCDAAPYIASKAGEGCVIPWVTETLHYSVSDPAVASAALHIRLAQRSPELTFPLKQGKVISGAPDTTPLHRTRDNAMIRAHRRTARSVCRSTFPGYARLGILQCDEYPFATTLEGANAASGNFSALPIVGTQNTNAGNRLGQFYTFRRMLGTAPNNDPFFVEIDN